jgi:hypothetical protein
MGMLARKGMIGIENTDTEGYGKHGFHTMAPTKLREVAAKAGRAAHAVGKAHKFNSEQARTAAIRKWEKHRERKAQDPDFIAKQQARAAKLRAQSNGCSE